MNRQPKGTPIGGQFAEGRKPDGGDLHVSADAGTNLFHIREGSRTPWGPADYVEHTAHGIVSVSTPGHGGVKLSPERNRMIPSVLRRSSGWYEEDCEVYIPMMYHPEAFVRDGQTVDEVRQFAENGIIRWFPDEYEAATGNQIPVGVSAQKDRSAWQALHVDDDVAISAITEGNGMAKVTVRRGGYSGAPGSDRVILVPLDDYDSDEFRHPLGAHAGSFVVDPSKDYRDITPPPKPPNAPAPRYRGVNMANLTPGARERAEIALKKRYRFSDGVVRSVRDIIEKEGISSKSSVMEGGRSPRRRYYLRYPSEPDGAPSTDTFYAIDVPKSLWDAVDAPAG